MNFYDNIWNLNISSLLNEKDGKTSNLSLKWKAFKD